MPCLTLSIARCCALVSLLAASAFADLRARYTLPDGGQRRSFIIATDEAQARGALKHTRPLFLQGAASAEAARQAAARAAVAAGAGEKAELVMYEEGQPRNEWSRRILTSRIA